jgi:acetyltransferase-like isoleucine patch superfamily enzyme
VLTIRLNNEFSPVYPEYFSAKFVEVDQVLPAQGGLLSLNINQIPGVRTLKKILRSDRLSRFNERTGNHLLSRHVPFEVLQGTEIWIQRETASDRKTRIGSYTFVGHRCTITASQIGRYCSIADNVTIGPGEHSLDGISTSAALMDDAFAEMTLGKCELGHDVWVGVDSIIRRGVSVGNGAVIGANSFVNHDVPPFGVVAGSPARLLRFRFSPEAIARIEASKWWELERDDARAMIAALKAELGVEAKAAF